MTVGNLFFYPYPMPLDAGTPIPGGKLIFTATGTSTPQDVFTTSALSVAHSNPVEADADGVWPPIFLTPSLQYRVRLTDANDVEIGAAVDGVNANVYPAVQTGSFTGTLTGYASGPTGTISYRLTGNECRLFISTAITGTSNANSLTVTGLPAAVRPSGNRTVNCVLVDNTVNVNAFGSLTSGSDTVTFAMGSPFSPTGFNTSGTKGLVQGWTITYSL